MPPLLLQGIREQWKARIFVLPSSFFQKARKASTFSLLEPLRSLLLSIDLTGSIETESKGANRQFKRLIPRLVEELAINADFAPHL